MIIKLKFSYRNLSLPSSLPASFSNSARLLGTFYRFVFDFYIIIYNFMFLLIYNYSLNAFYILYFYFFDFMSQYIFLIIMGLKSFKIIIFLQYE